MKKISISEMAWQKNASEEMANREESKESIEIMK